MKKFLYLLSLMVATMFLAGCGGGGSSGSTGGGGGAPTPAPVANFNVLYLDDEQIIGIAGVEYDCTSNSGFTDAEGGFSFLDGDSCTFYFTGFDGTVDYFDPIFMDYSDGEGVAGIAYDCASGISDFTQDSGGFPYSLDDVCTFYL